MDNMEATTMIGATQTSFPPYDEIVEDIVINPEDVSRALVEYYTAELSTRVLGSSRRTAALEFTFGDDHLTGDATPYGPHHIFVGGRSPKDDGRVVTFTITDLDSNGLSSKDWRVSGPIVLYKDTKDEDMLGMDHFLLTKG